VSTLDRIEQIVAEATDAIAQATDTAALEDARIRYLGRKAELPNLLRTVAELPPAERAQTGKAANEARQRLERAIEQREQALAASELQTRLEQDRIDITLPGDPLPAIGRLHVMTAMRREMEDVFVGLGFTIAEGPEVETVY
jgi:phenylalanyl-tRNA synthetase alpha chain